MIRVAVSQNAILQLTKILLCLTCVVGIFQAASAGPFEGMVLVYHATFGDGKLGSGIDRLGIGSLKPAGSADVPNSNPTWTAQGGDIELGVTRPTSLIGGLVSSALFATPVDFGQGSVFGMRAKFVAPQGPHSATSVFAVVLGAKTGDENDTNADMRTGASLQVRGTGARLNIPGASPPINLPNLPEEIYDAIFDPNNPRPFTLEFLVDRVTGQGEVTLKVDGFNLTQSAHFAVFQENSGPAITAIGPALAIANGPGQSASVRVREFEIFLPRRVGKDGLGDPCPPEFGCKVWPSTGDN